MLLQMKKKKTAPEPADALHIRLRAADGPGSTTDYTVVFQIAADADAVPDDDRQAADNEDVVLNTRQEDLIIEFHGGLQCSRGNQQHLRRCYLLRRRRIRTEDTPGTGYSGRQATKGYERCM